jgi:hypothetical protein
MAHRVPGPGVVMDRLNECYQCKMVGVRKMWEGLDFAESVSVGM